MKITHLGRTEHRLLAQEINAAIASVGTKYGVKLSAGGGVLGDMTGRINIEVEVLPAPGQMSAAQKEFITYCALLSLKPEHFGKTFLSNGRLFKVSGLNVSAPKYNLYGDEVGGRGRTFKFVASQVARQLNAPGTGIAA